MQIIAQVFGIGAMIALFSIYQQSKRQNLIAFKLCADVCWVVHYLCLNAIGGAIPNFVGIFRELVFINRKSKNWADKPIWPIVFILLNLTLGLITMKGYISLLPITAAVCVTVSLWLKNPTLTKIISFPAVVSFLIYDIFVGSWIGVINESLSLISMIIAITKRIKNERNNDNALS